MNRIVLVGNGFDLAHGLKTRYENFIEWYIMSWTEKNNRDCFPKKGDKLIEVELKKNILNKLYLCFASGKRFLKYNVKVSKLLERILLSIKTKGWADIEADYYKILVECIGKKDELVKLNKDFAFIQDLLIEYLNEIQEQKINENILCDNIKSAMLSPFAKEEIAVSTEMLWKNFAHNRADESMIGVFPHIFHDYEIYDLDTDKIKDLLNKNKTAILFDGECRDQRAKNFLLPDRIMLLNFNYTKTADLYLPNNTRFIVNHIHGDLSIPKTVIFGYGDESDNEYKKLHKINDNEYLRHIKTNRYLETPHYRDLLSFVDSAPFQVCIMGHSCGLSDRTLLNTLFEHKNCVSIKPYYYVNEQGEDNYLDIVQNISRNFTNPQLMRDRVVNKTFCDALPQFSI